jgi:mannose/fructose/N-acetylgalactosamine-specific phosphotransferase system component IID
MKPRTRPRLGLTLLRLFTVQGSWNYERMLGVGMGVAQEPLLRGLRNGPEGTAYRAAVARAAHFFNAHPYLCGLAVGAAARAEHDGVAPEQVERLRMTLCGPLGSLGDRLVWAGWLPGVSALALAGIALGLGWWAAAGFLVVYNAGHVALRWWALRAGWEYGTRVAAALHHPVLLRAAAVVGPLAALAAGFALPLAAAYIGHLLPLWMRGPAAGAALLGFFALRLWPNIVTGHRLGLAYVALALIGGLLWR